MLLGESYFHMQTANSYLIRDQAFRTIPPKPRLSLTFTVMKSTFPAALLIVALFAGCAPRTATPQEAMAYNNTLVSHGDTVLQAFDAFNSSVDAHDSVHVEKRLELAIVAAKRSVSAISAMKPIDGDSSLRDATLQVMRYYEDVFQSGFKRMLPILMADTLSEAEAISVDSLVHDFSFVEDSLRMLMLGAQNSFSVKYGLELH